MEQLQEQYKIQEIISDDGYVSFFVVRHRKTGKKFAVKGMNKRRANLYHLIQEVQIFSLIREHPHVNVMSCAELFEDANDIFLVHEYLPGGFKLAHFVSSSKSGKDRHVKKVFWGILKGLHHLHKLGIVHRDLNMETVYVNQKRKKKVGSQSTSWDVKLVNFSISSLYSYNTYLNTFCKSPFFSSPEMCKGLPYYGPEVDTWAAGVILYCLFYKRYPFAPDDNSSNSTLTSSNSPMTSTDALSNTSTDQDQDQNEDNQNQIKSNQTHHDNSSKKNKQVIIQSDESDAQKWMRELSRKIISGDMKFPDSEKNPNITKLIRQMLDTDPNKRPNLAAVMDDEWFADLRKEDQKKIKTCIKKLSFFN